MADIHGTRDELVTMIVSLRADLATYGNDTEATENRIIDAEFKVQELTVEIERLRVVLFKILLLDGKRLTGRQRWDHAVTLAKRAYDRTAPAPTAGEEK